MTSTLLQSISQDDYEKARFLSKRKFENDFESDKNTAIKIREYEMIKDMLSDGESMTKIMKYSKWTEEAIKEVKETLP